MSKRYVYLAVVYFSGDKFAKCAYFWTRSAATQFASSSLWQDRIGLSILPLEVFETANDAFLGSGEYHEN